MSFQFHETSNQEIIHNNDTVKYFSKLAFNSNEEILLDILIDSMQLDSYTERKEHIYKIKEYYSNKGIHFNIDEFEEKVDEFLNMNIGNFKGAFLEVLSYNLIKQYCPYNELYQECKVTHNGIKNDHIYDIIVVRTNNTSFIEIKFSCEYLNKTHIDHLMKYVTEIDVNSYLISLDSYYKVINKLTWIKNAEGISDEEYDNIKENIILLPITKIYETVLNKNCIIT